MSRTAVTAYPAQPAFDPTAPTTAAAPTAAADVHGGTR